MTRESWRAGQGKSRRTNEPDIPSGPAIRKIRGFGTESIDAHPERGLLLLYVISSENKEIESGDDAPPVIAFGISFPGSNSGLKVEYKVNNVLWEQEYGPAE